MIPHETVRRIFEAGAKAPSGSNSQPWKFRVHNDEVEVIALPERDHPILNFRYRGTWIAHGALFENIAIAAREFGYEAFFSTFPEPADHNITARITFKKSHMAGDPLYRAIDSRTTNRKPYDISPLSSEEHATLVGVIHKWKGGDVKAVLIDDQEKIQTLGKVSSVNEVVMFENEALHKLLFEEIVWTKEQEEARGKGLLFATMELKPPAAIIKALGTWSFMRILNFFGVARAIAKDNVKMYSAAPLVCAITAGDRDEDFIEAGRLMERLWLQATQMGLSVHLMTGVLFFWQRLSAGESQWFSEKHVALIQEAYQTTASIVGAGNKNVALLFRIGRGGEPSARSMKLPPVIEFI